MDSSNDVIQEILERLVRMETKLDDFTSLRSRADEAHNKSIQNEKDINEIKTKANDAFSESKQNTKDIKEIKDNIKWCWRTIVGAIIVGAVGIYMKFN